MRKDIVIDVRPKGENASLEEVLDFSVGVAVDSVTGVFNGIVGTAQDVIKTGAYLCEGNVGGASQIVKDRTHAVAQGVVDTIKSVSDLSLASYEAVVQDQAFVTEENKTKLTRICKAGIYGLLGSSLIDDSK